MAHPALRSKYTLPILIIGMAFFYWASVLSFFPVPWPDDSAFFLTGQEWIRSPSIYRMHSQAPWVPSYDSVNFNTMPLLPLLMGVCYRLGIGGVHAIRIFGMAVFAAWVCLLVAWMRSRKVSETWVWLVALGAITSPFIRWMGMVVRPEVWQGLLWFVILMDLGGYFKRACSWRIPIVLALAAYIHFEAAFWVPALALGLFPFEKTSSKKIQARDLLKEWVFKLWAVAWRTALLLSPWVVYVIAHWDVFWIQMGVQFHRMAGKHIFFDSVISFFHSIFLSLGNPVDLPKFYNFAKFFFWFLLIAGVVLNLQRAWKDRALASVRVAAAAGIGMMIFLWVDKWEAWFTGMLHMAVWSAIAVSFEPKARGAKTKLMALLPGWITLGILTLFSLAVMSVQWWKARPNYSWARFDRWVDCIESEIGDRRSVWQPNFPDVLVDLASRNPNRDYYRAVDFPGMEAQVRAAREKMQVMIHSTIIPPRFEMVPWEVYRGGPRVQDYYLLNDFPYITYNRMSALHFPGQGFVRVCQEGPFWAALSIQGQPPRGQESR